MEGVTSKERSDEASNLLFWCSFFEKRCGRANAFYHTKETIEHLLDLASFTDIKWHKPLVSKAGINEFLEKLFKQS